MTGVEKVRDEFLVMLSDVAAAHEAAHACRRILESILRSFPIEGREIFLTGSIGIASSAGGDTETEELLRQAEIAMYSSKDQGRNTFQFFDDKSFTRSIASDSRDVAITKALLAMAQRLDLNVVAEGVENEAQLSFLGENRSDEVQGYPFGRPIPAVQLTDVLRSRSRPALPLS